MTESRERRVVQRTTAGVVRRQFAGDLLLEQGKLLVKDRVEFVQIILVETEL
jgi:hypothetical protein